MTNPEAGVIFQNSIAGGMAERSKAAVLKTVEGVKLLREFESLSLRHEKDRRTQTTSQQPCGEMAESAEGARLLSECGV